jgi:two-component system cell cycle sensor histidine kinase/response regulator CckA
MLPEPLTKTPLRVLFVEDRDDDARLMLRELERSGYAVTSKRVDTENALRDTLGRETWDVVISDWSMPAFDALTALDICKHSESDIPFIIVSGTIGEEIAVDALRAGAKDFILKGKLARLTTAVGRELREREGRVARKRAEEALRNTEEQLRQAQKMEAVGRLAGGVAHDFNNLLSVILSYASLVLSDEEINEETREAVTEMQKAGVRAADLTRQLLAFSRHQVVTTQILDVNSVLVGMDKMLKRILGEDVELVTLTAPRLAKIRADRGRIEQVVMNLVVNARDAMPHGGNLTVATHDATLDDAGASPVVAKAGPYVVLSVRDNGVGMDEATKARIFEPFFTTKPLGKGTGLGLSTVFGIVQQCGGTIRVVSERGAGATFEVYLPAVAETQTREANPSTPLPLRRAASETILLVEDDDQVRNLTHSILRRSGYTVIEATNASDARRACNEHKSTIDLILTDVVLPGANGIQMIEDLMRILPNVKVICMSGYAGDTATQQRIAEAKLPFLQKPITPELLSRKLREVLDA